MSGRRPKIKPGDIVRFSKKGKEANYPWPDNIKMIVTDIDTPADSREARCLVKCRAVIDGKSTTIAAYRHHLWFTGKNLSEVKKTKVMNSDKD